VFCHKFQKEITELSRYISFSPNEKEKISYILMKTYILNEQLILLTTSMKNYTIRKEFNSSSLVGERLLYLQDEVELC